MRGNRARPAAFFDLDKTIIAKSSTLAFSKPFFAEGLLSRRTVLRSAYAQFIFAASGADHDRLAKMRDAIAAMVTGWDVATVRQAIDEALHDVIDPMIHAEAIELIRQHQSEGHDVIIISASGAEMVNPIGQKLGVDHVIATEMSILDGKFTGEITFYAYGPNKAAAMREMADRYGYNLAASFAYSDSETDIPMLEAVGHPFAVNPDKVLRRKAAAEDWPILEFSRPVALSSHLRLDSRAARLTATAAALGTLAVVGVVISAVRRRDLQPA